MFSYNNLFDVASVFQLGSIVQVREPSLAWIGREFGSYSFLFGPLLAFGGLGVLILFLRWAFRRGSSVVAAPPRPGNPDEYGVLVPIASPSTYMEGEIWRLHLEAHGIRANLTQTKHGARLLVWPSDADAALNVLSTMR
jgi:hypothetical protein